MVQQQHRARRPPRGPHLLRRPPRQPHGRRLLEHLPEQGRYALILPHLSTLRPFSSPPYPSARGFMFQSTHTPSTSPEIHPRPRHHRRFRRHRASSHAPARRVHDRGQREEGQEGGA